MAPCGKNRTVSLQKLPSPISSEENILGYEGEISLGKTACKAQETRKGIRLAFCFSCSCVHLSLPGLQCKFSLLLHGNHLLWDKSLREGKWERGQRLQFCLGWSLCRGWQLAGKCRFPACHCFNLLYSLVSQAQNTWCQGHVQECKYQYMSSWCASFADATTIQPQHRVMPSALHILTC